MNLCPAKRQFPTFSLPCSREAGHIGSHLNIDTDLLWIEVETLRSHPMRTKYLDGLARDLADRHKRIDTARSAR